jgi:hypothetical protein
MVGGIVDSQRGYQFPQTTMSCSLAITLVLTTASLTITT